jgi:hypothetical protein
MPSSHLTHVNGQSSYQITRPPPEPIEELRAEPTGPFLKRQKAPPPQKKGDIALFREVIGGAPSQKKGDIALFQVVNRGCVR